MNYQYKAHGVQRLGLKRGLDRELVVSPYSTFLTLPLAPESGVKNLRALAAMGLEGRYGLCEAADFTPGRVNGAAKYEPVRSYMAHHLGMSLVALDNALNDGIMQKRFMRDAAMGAYRELLQEKVPVGAQVLHSPRDEVPDKPGRRGGEPFLRTGRAMIGMPCLSPNDRRGMAGFCAPMRGRPGREWDGPR
ncbi:MAG: glucoamylase family protein [Intestinimonas sp.]